ncbi:cation:dicarboxylate symporter family transporter [Terrisporobacter glycolicus]|uniref:L-cystine uptake protein TcyP n=1 Tax=Terrisporobacter glycolicus ATCC 14880 = DSM 1288 TaxID=1121315 RepID=A0ABZ2EXE7_9FIRM|nr:cation:dicarboxylase symporter family transporter [Terrisporobacter glycolicus]
MSSTFFSQFLMITNVLTLISIVALIIIFSVLKKLSKKLDFTKLMISSTIIGVFLGVAIQYMAKFPSDPSKVIWLTEVGKWYGLFGYGFMDLLKMLVVPIVFLSIVRVIMNLKSSENIGKLTFRSVGMLLGTTAIAATVGIIVGNLFKLGVSDTVISSSVNQMKEITPVVDTLRNLLPSNPVQAMAEANIVAIVVFATFIGLAIKRLNNKHAQAIKPFVDFVEAFYKIIISVSITVIKFMPYAVVAMMANAIVGRGVSAIFDVIDFIIALYVSILIMFIIHLMIITLSGVNPITYLKGVSKALVLALTSRSSVGTLPVTVESLTENLKIDEGIASFVTSLGSNMGMNGCAGIYPALMAVTIAHMSGTQMDFSFYVMLIIVITISSLGIAGIPGTAAMAVSVVISGVGMGAFFPYAGGILAIDPILDMGRTMLNVNGSMTSTVVVAKSLNKINKKE